MSSQLLTQTLWREDIARAFADSANRHAAQPQLVLLDLDGTLIDSVATLAMGVDAMLLELGYTAVGSERVSHWVGNGADKLVRRALAFAQCGGEMPDLEQQADALANEPVSAARALFDRHYLAALSGEDNQLLKQSVFAGVEAFLSRLFGAGVNTSTTMVLVTNKPRLFTEVLINALGWQHYFHSLICGDDLAEKKPSPLPLLHACKLTDIAPERALMVGDSRHDINAAKAAGIATLAVSYGYNHGEPIAQAKPDWLVDNLTAALV